MPTSRLPFINTTTALAQTLIPQGQRVDFGSMSPVGFAAAVLQGVMAAADAADSNNIGICGLRYLDADNVWHDLASFTWTGGLGADGNPILPQIVATPIPPGTIAVGGFFQPTSGSLSVGFTMTLQ